MFVHCVKTLHHIRRNVDRPTQNSKFLILFMGVLGREKLHGGRWSEYYFWGKCKFRSNIQIIHKLISTDFQNLEKNDICLFKTNFENFALKSIFDSCSPTSELHAGKILQTNSIECGKLSAGSKQSHYYLESGSARLENAAAAFYHLLSSSGRSFLAGRRIAASSIEHVP